MAIDADSNANVNSPIAVAVLVVYDDGVFQDLAKLSAGEWFTQAEQRQRDNPEMAGFDLLSWEIMPSQRVRQMTVQLQGREAKGLVFADYLTQGSHRIRFNPEKRILVVLRESDFSVIDRGDDDDDDESD